MTMMTTRRRQQRIARGVGSGRCCSSSSNTKSSSSTLISSSLCTVRSFFLIGLMGFFLLQIFTFVILDGLTLSTTTIGRNMMESKSKSTITTVTVTSGKKTRDDDDENNLLEIDENENENEVEKPIVMIGGSDGSGTRAIVELLRELGTIIVSDDPQTFDVHASELSNGWPGFIQRVYSVTDGTSGTIFSSSSSTSSSNNSISNSNNTSVLLNNNYDWPPLPPTQMEEDKDEDKDEKRRMKNNIANVEAEIMTLKQSWDFKYGTIAKPIHQQEYYNRRRTIQQDISPIAAAFSNGNGGRHTTFPALAQNVKYAIKAPVSMLVLPVIVSSFRRKQKQELVAKGERNHQKQKPILKFLHVIRDGRDVAVSENQSPVFKFYNLTYPTTSTARMRLLQFTNEMIISSLTATVVPKLNANATGEEDHHQQQQQQQQLANINTIIIYAKAIQLWNDWNSMVYRWATTNAVQHNNDVDYLLIKIEDLLIAGSPERYTAIVQMSNYVNSTLSIEELCCLCRKDTQDYGKSSKINTFNHGNVNNNHRNKNKSENDNKDTDDDNNNIIARWELQQRDKQKREQQRQQQQHLSTNTDQKQEYKRRRRLMLMTKEKDPLIISEEDYHNWKVDYHNWKIVTDRILKKKKKKNTDDTKMYVVDGLIRHGEELYARRQQQQQKSTIIGIKNVKQQQQQVDDDNDNQEGIHRSIIEELKMKLKQIRMEIHNRMANNANANNSKSNNISLNQRPSDPTIKKRYGKWQSILKKNTALSNFFHHEGAEGLKLFGYYDNDAAVAVVPSSSLSKSSSSVVKDTNPDDSITGGGINICEVSIACPE